MYDKAPIWIWCPEQVSGSELNCYILFSEDFFLDSIPPSAGLRISASDEYAVFVNGTFAGCNQYDDMPGIKSYDLIELAPYFKQGSNTLAIVAYSQGENSFQNIYTKARLSYYLESGDLILQSGSHTLCTLTGYRSGEMERVSPQLSFTFWYNASFVPPEPLPSIVVEPNEEVFHPRPIERLKVDAALHSKLIAQGYFLSLDDALKKTPAEAVYSDFLSPRNNSLWELSGAASSRYTLAYENPILDGVCEISLKPEAIEAAPENGGIYFLIDLGREEAGFPVLELNAAEGTVIDIGYGEHLEDLRVRSYVGSRHFGFRYICKEGPQSFTHYYRRIAGRYLQLHVRNPFKHFTLKRATLLPVTYSVKHTAKFYCNDSLLTKIWDVGVRTLHLCMHEHYEDTPWREQALYAMDSRNQALAGYYAFGESQFPAAAFRLLGLSLREDGYLELCAPCKFFRTIPSFTFAWITAVQELALYGGEIEAVKEMLPAVVSILDKTISNLQGGLLPNPQGQAYWNYYDWETDLFGDGRKGGEIEAPLNALVAKALENGAYLCKLFRQEALVEKYTAAREKMLQQFHLKFWDEKRQAYKTTADSSVDAPIAELTQALALWCGAAPQETAVKLRERLASDTNGWTPMTLSSFIFYIDALMAEPDKYAQHILEIILDRWGHMLYNGATSFWETKLGGDDFDKAGSLCHGWSAVPVYFLGRYILGIRPDEPGFSKYTVQSYKGIDRINAVIPSPSGEIVI